MSKRVKVAIIDSGCHFETFDKVAVFVDENHQVTYSKQCDINLTHGNVIGNIIKDECIDILDIQVFNENLATTPLHIFYALQYLADKEVDVINLSLGLNSNYKEIEEMCTSLIQSGVTIVASYPRRSTMSVFPASYDGVIKVTSEGLCKNDKVVGLDDNLEYFGANPFSSIKEVSGSSVAVAKFTREYSQYLLKGFEKREILEEFSKRRVDAIN